MDNKWAVMGGNLDQVLQKPLLSHDKIEFHPNMGCAQSRILFPWLPSHYVVLLLYIDIASPSIAYTLLEENIIRKCIKISIRQITCWFSINTLRLRRNGRHFVDNVFNCIFLNENIWISIKISLTFVPKGPINNIAALVQIMAWRRPGDKPLSEPMMVVLSTHICVTRPQ